MIVSTREWLGKQLVDKLRSYQPSLPCPKHARWLIIYNYYTTNLFISHFVWKKQQLLKDVHEIHVQPWPIFPSLTLASWGKTPTPSPLECSHHTFHSVLVVMRRRLGGQGGGLGSEYRSSHIIINSPRSLPVRNCSSTWGSTLAMGFRAASLRWRWLDFFLVRTSSSLSCPHRGKNTTRE